MPASRFSLSASVADEFVYAIGGAFFGNGLVFSAVEEYDPQTDMWIRKSDMPTPRHSFEIAAVSGNIHAS